MSRNLLTLIKILNLKIDESWQSSTSENCNSYRLLQSLIFIGPAQSLLYKPKCTTCIWVLENTLHLNLQGKYGVVLDEINKSSPKELQPIRTLAEYLQNPARR